MEKKIHLKIKTDLSKVPNKLHLEIQKRNRMEIFKPRKGKGSFKRNKKVEDYE